MHADFLALWKSILEDCGMEMIPEAKLRRLAANAGEEEMRFLLEEGERIGREWAELRDRGGDPGDGSDEYWRMAASVEKAFALMGAKAVPIVLEKLRQSALSRRQAALPLLRSLRAHVEPADLRTAFDGDKEEAVEEALRLVFGAEPEPRRWWQVWK